jgi:hypothetical protein
VHGVNDPLPQQPVVKHEHGPIEVFELVVPQNMNNSRLGGRGVANESNVILQHPQDLFREPGIRSLIAAQIEKLHSWIVGQFRAIEFIDANQIQGCPIGRK